MIISNQLKNAQSGMATLLVVIVIGMLLTVTTLGVVYSGRSTQDKQVTVHAVTHAQAGVWNGAEVVKAYLKSLDDNERAALTKDMKFVLKAGDAASYTVTIIEPYELADPEVKFEVAIEYTDADAKSSSTIQTLIHIEDRIERKLENSGAMNFNGDLNLEGGVDVSNVFDVSVVTVDGEVNIGGVGLTGLEEILATGTIRTGSSTNLTLLYSNEDIVVTGGATIGEAKAVGDILTTGGSSIVSATANGFIVYSASGNATTIDALGIDENGDQIEAGTAVICEDQEDVCTTASASAITNQFNGESFVAMVSGSPTVGALNAQGNVVLGGSNFTSVNAGQINDSSVRYGGVRKLKSDSSVNISSYLNTYGDVQLTGSATDAQITSYGSVSVNGADSIYADGAVDFLGYNTIESIIAGGDINTVGAISQTIRSGGDINFQGGSLGGTVRPYAKGTITCPGTYWGKTNIFYYGTNIEKCGGLSAKIAGFNITPVDFTFTPLVPVPKQEFEDKPYVDIWELEDIANYVFEAEENNGRIDLTVTIQDVKLGSIGEIESEKYYLVAGSNKQLLCDDFNVNSGKCKSALLDKSICVTNNNNGCFGAEKIGDDIYWRMGNSGGDSEEMVPGVYLFKGEVTLTNMNTVATVLATRSVQTSNDFKLKSLNYATFDQVCNAGKDPIVAGIYPIDYCDFDKKALIPSTVGNVAIGAGGRNPDTTENPNDLYEGGDIYFGASTEIWGTIMAGNQIQSNGGVTVHGYVVALDWNDDPDHTVLGNDLKGKLTITLDNSVPPSYEPGVIPSIKNLCVETGLDKYCNHDEVTFEDDDYEIFKGDGDPKTIWTRYL